MLDDHLDAVNGKREPRTLGCTITPTMTWVRPCLCAFAAALCLLGCATGASPVAPAYTQDELKAACDRQRGWWRPDDLRGGYCDFRGP